MSCRILILGGYGIFGSRITGALSRDALLELIIAGRNRDAADRLVTVLAPQARSALRAVALDINSGKFAEQLSILRPDLVIHTCGPFQGQDYHVARTCIEAGIDYLDLADSRGFVSGFDALNDSACAARVTAITGSSSVPALSAAVVDHFLPGFAELHCIDHGISPGNRTPRGLATVRSILGYCGKPFLQWSDGEHKTVYGWQGLARRQYPEPMGRRWLGYCDVPDLALFPLRYPHLRTVRFSAGLELPLLHLGTWLLSWLVRAGWVDDWARYAAPLKRISEWFQGAGSARGGMHVEMAGIGLDGAPHKCTWYILADCGDGIQIPCTAAIIVARKMAHGNIRQAGALPCMGLFTLEEFMQELDELDIQQITETAPCPCMLQ